MTMTPKFRQALYALGVVCFAALAVLSTFKIIDPNTAASVSAAVTSVLGLFGVTISGVAAYHVNTKGTPEPVSPADQVIGGLNQIAAQEADLKQAKEAVAAAVQNIPVAGPVLGPLARQVIDGL
jgi:hypothetical protein